MATPGCCRIVKRFRPTRPVRVHCKATVRAMSLPGKCDDSRFPETSVKVCHRNRYLPCVDENAICHDASTFSRESAPSDRASDILPIARTKRGHSRLIGFKSLVPPRKRKSPLSQAFRGGQGRIRTFVARSATDLQSVAFNLSATYPHMQLSRAIRTRCTASTAARPAPQVMRGRVIIVTGSLPVKHPGPPDERELHTTLRRTGPRPAM